MASRVRKLVKRFLGFSATSTLGTVVDMLILWICSDFIFTSSFGQFYLSPFISFEFAVLTNFSCAYFFVWSDRISKRSVRNFFHHYLGYNLSCTAVFLVKMVFLQLFHYAFPRLDVLLCNILALCCSGTLNFVMTEFVVFREKKKSSSPPEEEK